ncbi:MULTISPECIES: VWA domain-containing protein [unclassified Caballeronia]|uniref:TadE/TadG family type IV pilus assembly protein n=1 Tax=unclassified Caballeronia TaxID=2646786 RepID=UPI0020297617|nr:MULTISPECIES: VWA domain-containing protein [unclassified Caballeronia]MDR5800706.1 VWA domain-containing protein [Caballeronia sp. LZ001]
MKRRLFPMRRGASSCATPALRAPFFANFGGPAAPRTLAQLVRGDEGALTVLFAVTASMMIGTLCTAIDTIDYAQTQGRMQMALDVATLSAGADLSHYAMTTSADLAAWQADARAYYNANMPTGYMSLTMPDQNFAASVSGTPATGQVIKLSASGSVPLYAPTFLNTKSTSSSGSGSGSGSSGSTLPSTQTISASNTALRVPKSTLELALILDNTGSMASAAAKGGKTSKLSGLQDAANSLVANILGVQGNDSYIGLVPFTTMVNVGSALSSSGTWMTQTTSKQFAYNPTNMSMSKWGGCAVEPRDTAGNVYPKAYAPKDSPGFTPWYFNVPSTGFTVQTYDNNCNLQKNGTTVVKGVPLSYAYYYASPGLCQSKTPTTVPTNFMAQYPYSGTVTYDQNGSDYDSRPCSIQPAVFLTQDQNALTTAINNMVANGSTLIPTGLLWGWRMLSSDWSKSVAGSNNGWISNDGTLPRPETTQGLQRVAIVLTDGENDPGDPSGTMPQPFFNQLALGNQTLKSPTVYDSTGNALNGLVSSPDDVNTFQLGICQAMKNSGIIIYAITFGTYGTDSASVAAQNTMQSCATSGNYYHAPDNATLNQIFQQIAGNLGVLRLTQ